MTRTLLAASVLLFAAPAFAQHIHEKGPNGGPVEDIAGVEVEMVASGKSLTFNVFDETKKPLPTSGYTGSVLLVSQGNRETLQLTPAGNALKGEAKADIAKGASVSVTLRTAAGRSGQARFKN